MTMPERTPPPSPGGGGVSKKMMGLPLWGWFALAAAGGIAFFVWRQKNAASTTAATTDTSNTDTANGLDQGQYESLLATLRDIQGSLSTESGDTTGSGASTQPANGNTGNTPPVNENHVPGYGWYRVQKGDSPNAIASKYKISLAQFYAWNGKRALAPGRYVKVRGSSNPTTGYKG